MGEAGESSRGAASAGGENHVLSQNENTFCSNPETFPDRRRAHRLLLGLKSRFIFSPVHQPDCSSDPRMWPPLSGVDCWLELDGNCVLIHDCNIQGGESESLVSADLSERLTWIKTRTHTHPCYVCMLIRWLVNTPSNYQHCQWKSIQHDWWAQMFTDGVMFYSRYV